MTHQRILLVEDDSSLAELMQEELEAEGYRVDHRLDAEQALTDWPSLQAEVVVSDLRLPGMSGLDFLHRLRQLEGDPAFLMITAFGSINQAVEALKAGADDFLTKPFSIDHFLLTISRLLQHRSLHAEVERYRQLMGTPGFHGIVGSSAAMLSLFEQIRIIARSQGPVLITGESGVGKELVARALHAESERADAVFLAVNCAGIPAELLESEFFGHVAGAFTGARAARKGLLSEASGGTLLLDEIGEMPVHLQAKLLRALQEGKVRPVGAEHEEPVDVRIIAATNRDLLTLTRSGDFREDLFYRLETFTIHVPALREREDDWELLAAHFLRQFSARLNKPEPSLSANTLKLLRRYGFPGNVRELQNAIERAATFCEGRSIEPEHLPARIQNFEQTPSAADSDLSSWLRAGPQLMSLDELQRQYVNHVMEKTAGNKREAADILGVTRRTLYRWLDNQRENG